MTVSVHVPGSALIKTGTGSSAALESLGYTVDGVDIQEKEFVIDVKSDRYGGSQGPSIDVQLLGLGAELRMELVEIDLEVFVKLQSRLPTKSGGQTMGVVPTPGCLTFGDGGLFRTLILGTKDAEEIAANGSIDLDTLLTPRNYPFCRVVGAVGYNLGTRHAKASLTIEAYQGLVSTDVVVWNRISA